MSTDTVAADREALANVLIQHQRKDIGHCLCGWGQDPRHLGLSHAAHVVDEALVTGVVRDAVEVRREAFSNAESQAHMEARWQTEQAVGLPPNRADKHRYAARRVTELEHTFRYWAQGDTDPPPP